MRTLTQGLCLAVVGAGLAAVAPISLADAAAPAARLTVPPGSLSGATGTADDTAGPTPAALDPSRRDGADDGPTTYLLELSGRPTATVYDAARASGTRAQAAAAASTRLSAITRQQDAAIAALPAGSSVLYRTHAVLPGLAVRTDATNLAELKTLPGVTSVHEIVPKTISNSYAVPLQGAPAVWEGRGDLGQNTRIGIIDTGIDYTHANFGGPGTVAAYDAAGAAGAQSSFTPTTKVVGGYDLVGDDYNADPSGASGPYQPVPHPDANPLDCNGHGSHVAGTAAGYGENADGSTYTGAYNTSTPFDTMKIGPGMAPQAKLWAIRVFGCEGSTDVVGEALDRAMDPNQDGSTADHLDVVNMSLGGDYGSPQDGDSVMTNAASDAGIVVAVASGNGGDFQDVGGSPGDAVKALTVANSQDASSVVDALNFTTADGAQKAAASRSIAYDWDTKADLSGQVVALKTAGGDYDTACSALTSAQASAVAGKIALVKWTQEALECGSVQRSGNLAAAGAKGFIFANSAETFSAGITGSAVIPGVLVSLSGANKIKAALAANQTVTVTGTTANGFTQTFPADNDKISDSSSRGIHAAGDVKPDVTAVGTSVFSTANGTGTGGVSETGTSMATPMVAGLAALVRSANPTWNPEQVKADIMNTAGQDIYVNGSAATAKGATYAPNRVGAGRIQAYAALNNSVLAYNAEDTGAVSVSFGPVEASGPVTLTKKVTVQNTGTSSATYAASYQAITSVPGVKYSVAPSEVTVAPGASSTITVTLSIADPKVLTKTVDPTIGRTTLSGEYPREVLSDASGRVLLTPDSVGSPTLRVPVYSAPRPASVMSQDARASMPTGTDTATLHLNGSDLGAAGANGTGDADTSNDISSLAAGFELQATSGVAPDCSTTVTTMCARLPEEHDADLKYVGVTSDYPSVDAGDAQAYIAIATQAPWSVPASKVEFDTYIDTTGDHTPDLVAYTTRLGDDDLFVVNLLDLKTNKVVDTELVNGRFGDVDTALYDSDTMFVPIWLSALASYGISPSNPTIHYGVLGYSGYTSGAIDAVGVDTASGQVELTANLYAPAITVTDADGGPLVNDTNGAAVTVTRNPASYAADKGQGILMLHLHNKVGNKAQVVPITVPSTVSAVHTPEPSTFGQASSVTVTGSSGATGTVTLTEGSTTVGSGTMTSGAASIALPATYAVGTHTLTVAYSGDDSYDPSSTTVTVTIKAAPAVATTITATPDPKKVTQGKPLDVDVVLAAASGTPSGTVTVTEKGKTLGTATITGSGAVSVKTKKLKPGKHTLTVAFAGSSSFTAAQTTTTVKVKAKGHGKGRGKHHGKK